MNIFNQYSKDDEWAPEVNPYSWKDLAVDLGAAAAFVLVIAVIISAAVIFG